MTIAYSEPSGYRSTTQTRDWKRQYTRVFRAVTDDPRVGSRAVRIGLKDMSGHAIGLGSAYQVFDEAGLLWEEDLGSFASTITAAEDGASDDGCQWLVTVEYTPYDANTYPINPIDWPIQVSWAQQRFEQVADTDILTAKPIANAAGDRFDPLPTRDDSRWILRIVRNQPKFDPTWADTYKDATNTDAFFGYAPGYWKVTSITSGDPVHDTDSQTADGYYYKVAFEFELNPDTWTANLLNQGVRQVVGVHLEQILDDKGTPVSSPVLLDAMGVKLDVGGTPVFLPFTIYRQAAYGDLGLDPIGSPTWSN